MTCTALVLLAALGTAGIFIAGCGGAGPAAVASLSTTASGTGRAATVTESRRAFAACLTDHGFAASVGGTGSVQVFGVAVAGGVDPSSSRFQSALAACRKDLPGGGPPAMSPAQRATWSAGLARFAACIRRNGVPDFPGPDGSGRLPISTLGQSYFQTPQFEHAYAACKSQLPTGPGLPRISLP